MTGSNTIKPVVSSAWLAAHYDSVVIIDGSWHMPDAGRNAYAEHHAVHLPGACFVDIDTLSDRASPYPHMLPSIPAFEEAMQVLGITRDAKVVIYDQSGLFSAARVWWMFRVFGHANVSVLDGGLPKWLAEGRKTESGAPPQMTAAAYRATFQPELVWDFDSMAANVASNAVQVIDVRSAARFSGTAPEPRVGLRSGHIPGSVNVPWTELVTPPYHTFRTSPELQSIFETAGIDLQHPIIASCGSGVTACILALALAQLGRADVAVYDGSWAEWAMRTPA